MAAGSLPHIGYGFLQELREEFLFLVAEIGYHHGFVFLNDAVHGIRAGLTFRQDKNAFTAANDMLRPGFTGPLTLLLKRKGFIESAGATKPALGFLASVKRAF